MNKYEKKKMTAIVKGTVAAAGMMVYAYYATPMCEYDPTDPTHYRLGNASWACPVARDYFDVNEFFSASTTTYNEIRWS